MEGYLALIAGVLSKSPSLNDGGGAAEHRENTSGIRTCQQGKLRFLQTLLGDTTTRACSLPGRVSHI